jgi:hypothetical protein
MRNLTDERGAVAVITAVLLIAMLGMGAIVIDVGSLYHERRVLQNGADAAALAVAQTCAAGTCNTAIAQTYADDNNPSSGPPVSVSVPPGNVCGSRPELTPCTKPPSGVQNYLRVTAASTVNYTFARALGFSQGAVNASAVVAWGGPASLTSTLPLTISVCEFARYSDADGGDDPFNPNAGGAWDTDAKTDTVGDLAPPPPYPPYPKSPYQEAVLYLHNTTGASNCPAGPAGSDLPGGFGWLQTSAGCNTPSSIDNWYNDKTGRPPPTSCTWQLMAQSWKTVVKVPIFTNTNGLTGSNGRYYINNYASFYVTGYSINGQYNEKSVVTGNYPCSGSASCISGFFVNDPTPVPGTVGGPSTGATVLQLIG